MQSSIENSSDSRQLRPSADDELEEGEIKEEDDDYQMIPCTSSKIQFDLLDSSNDSVEIIDVHPPASSNSTISSPSKSTELQTDRYAGGFWAKLTAATSGFYQGGQMQNKLDSSPKIRAARGENLDMSVNSDAIVNSRSGFESVPPTSNYLGYSKNIGSPAIKITEQNASEEREVSSSAKGNLRIRIIPTNGASNRVLEKNNRDADDDDELLELELRLQALQSTMKNSVDVANEKSVNNTWTSRRLRTRRDRSGSPGNRYNLPSTRLAERRSNRIRLDEHYPSAGYQLRKTRSERLDYQQHRRPVRFEIKNARPHKTSGLSQGQSPYHKPPNGTRQQQYTRERILNMPDPKQQYHAFLDMVTTPRPEFATGIGVNNAADDFDTRSMDISDDSENERPVSSSSKSGLQQPPTTPPLIQSPQTATSSRICEVENGSANLEEETAAAPSVITPSSSTPPAAMNHELVADIDEDEMEALRELALSSMLKSKAKKHQPPVKIETPVKLQSPSTSAILVDPHQPPNLSVDTRGENENQRVHHTGNDASVPAEVSPTAVTEMKKPIKPTPSCAMQSKPNNVSTSVSSTSLSRMESNDIASNQRTRPAIAKTRMPQMVQMINKPVVIPLETDSSSDEDEGGSSGAQSNRPEKKAYSGVSIDTRSTVRDLLSGFLKAKPNGIVNPRLIASGHQQRRAEGTTTSSTSSDASLVVQLEERLLVCMDDLTKHRSSVEEDQKRLRTLESIVSRKQADLRLAEVRMQKLKQELRTVESQTAVCRVTISKFNAEIQKVQSRVDKNVDLQRAYVRQWQEIEQLVAKHKISVLPKVSPPCPDAVQKRAPPQRLAITRKRLSAADILKAQAKKRFKTAVKQQQEQAGAKTKLSPTVNNAAIACGEDGRSNPLRWFRNYRLWPNFPTSCLGSPSHSNKLDPFVPLCPFELSGNCLDPECSWQHERDYKFTEIELIVDILSYRPDVVAKNADENATRIFANALYESLRGYMNMDEILAYCISKVNVPSPDEDQSPWAAEMESRKWTIRPNSKSRNRESMEVNQPAFDAIKDESNKNTNIRYFHGTISVEENSTSPSLPKDAAVDEAKNDAGS